MAASLRAAIALLFAAMVPALPLEAGRAQSAATIETGKGQQIAVVAGKKLRVATYRPKDCSPGLLLAVFHGIDRNAGTYRDRARPLADNLCAVMIAPEFDFSNFPRNLYAYGGLEDHGRLIEPGARAVDLVEPLIAWARSGLERRNLPYVLVGHSAGGQFLSRLAAFSDTQAARIVIANPSSWVMASTTVALPFGFGGLKPIEKAEEAMRLYLERSIIVALGRQDTGNQDLDQSIEAQKEGTTRYDRGRNAYYMAKAVATSRGWPFNWTLVEIDGVGHSSTLMMNAARIVASLKFVSAATSR